MKYYANGDYENRGIYKIRVYLQHHEFKGCFDYEINNNDEIALKNTKLFDLKLYSKFNKLSLQKLRFIGCNIEFHEKNNEGYNDFVITLYNENKQQKNIDVLCADGFNKLITGYRIIDFTKDKEHYK